MFKFILPLAVVLIDYASKFFDWGDYIIKFICGPFIPIHSFIFNESVLWIWDIEKIKEQINQDIVQPSFSGDAKQHLIYIAMVGYFLIGTIIDKVIYFYKKKSVDSSKKDGNAE